MKVPVSWLREYVDFDWPVEELARKLVFTSCEVDRVVHRGVADADGNLGRFLVGHVVEAGKHPNADRLQLCRVDVGEGEPRQIVCGAWNFGAGATVAVALPGALLPGADAAARRGEAPRRDLARDDPLRARARARRRPQRDHGARERARARDAARGRAAAQRDGARDRDRLQPAGPHRDLRDRARGLGARRARSWRRRPGAEPERAGDEPVDVRVEDFEACPRYIGRIFRGATVGPSPPWLKARLLAAGHALDLERRRHHELRHARARLAAARIRPLAARGGQDRRPSRAPGGEDPHAGRPRARARADRPRDRGRDAARRGRGDHGRRGQRGPRRDDGHPARGGELRRADRAAHVAAAAAPHRRLDALGEGRRPVRGRAGGDLRDASCSSRSPARAGRATPTCTGSCRCRPSSGTVPSSSSGSPG